MINKLEDKKCRIIKNIHKRDIYVRQCCKNKDVLKDKIEYR